MPFIDYSEAFLDAVAVHGNGRNVLLLFKCASPVRRMDKKLANYELIYRWLSADCGHPKDESWACVEGAESTYWTDAEMARAMAAVEEGGSLFDHFNLF